MNESGKGLPEQTIETLARNIFKETTNYGFGQVDYIRFVNTFLDISMKYSRTTKQNSQQKNEKKRTSDSYFQELSPIQLPFTGEKIKIRTFEMSQDIDFFKKWLTDEFGQYFLISHSTAQITNFDDFVKCNSSIIGVITLHSGTPIGSVAFLNYDPAQRKAEMRKLIGEPKMRGKGYAKEATQIWIQYGLTTLDLHKIYLNTLDTNIRNIKLNEELGFKIEGILRNELLFNGKFHDVLRMGLCKA